MLPSERKQRILGLLRERNDVSVQALAEMLQTPTASIRRDLRELETENRIARRHGRAIFRPSALQAPVEEGEDLDPRVLDELVQETALLLADTRNLYLAGGAVVARVAKEIARKTVATHDLAVALAAASAGNDVTLVGREVDNRTLTLRSPALEQELAEFWFDAVVAEPDGIDDRNLWFARQHSAVLPATLARADSLLVVAKSSALGRKGDRIAAPLTRADVVVVDRAISDSARKALGDAGVEVRVSGGEGGGFGLDRVGNIYVFRKSGSRFGRGGGALAEALDDAHDEGEAPADDPGD